MEIKRYWFVNQTSSWPKPYNGNYLWAPLLDKATKREPRSNWAWDTMDEIKKDDLIFCCVKSSIVAIAKARNSSYRSEKPVNIKDSEWQREGRKIDVDYSKLENIVVLKDHLDKIINYRVFNGRTLFTVDGKGLEFYLAEMSEDLAKYFLQFADKNLFYYTKTQERISEVVVLDIPGKKRKTVEVTSTRIIRDTDLTEKIKEMYDYKCQICDISISPTNTKKGKYVEAAHIRPISGHKGDDKSNNIICLCPNHHTMLDYGSISINDDLTVIGLDGRKIFTKSDHKINKENLKYHRENIYFKK